MTNPTEEIKQKIIQKAMNSVYNLIGRTSQNEMPIIQLRKEPGFIPSLAINIVDKISGISNAYDINSVNKLLISFKEGKQSEGLNPNVGFILNIQDKNDDLKLKASVYGGEVKGKDGKIIVYPVGNVMNYSPLSNKLSEIVAQEVNKLLNKEVSKINVNIGDE